jgi:hypothetical protein
VREATTRQPARLSFSCYRRFIVRRLTVLVAVAVMLLVGGLAVAVQPGVVAQEATPSGEDFELP